MIWLLPVIMHMPWRPWVTFAIVSVLLSGYLLLIVVSTFTIVLKGVDTITFAFSSLLVNSKNRNKEITHI